MPLMYRDERTASGVLDAPDRGLGLSTASGRLESEIDRAAASDAPVLITGESGLGKVDVARLIHQRSSRASAPFLTLNCAGLPDGLLSSAVFGHMAGSFAGAYSDKPGLLELAHGGSLFLNEVAGTSAGMQDELLRFLDSGDLKRVGAARPHGHGNVRIITGASGDLDHQVRAGTFRRDLCSRLNQIQVTVPPLRERTEDIPRLVHQLLDGYSLMLDAPRLGVSDQAMSALVQSPWRGNVSELQGVLERLVLAAAGPAIELNHLPVEFRSPA